MKKIKTLKCKTCGKEYTFHNGWLERHVAKTGHITFKGINQKLSIENFDKTPKKLNRKIYKYKLL